MMDGLPLVCFRGRYWGRSGHGLLQRICLLMTQSALSVWHLSPIFSLPKTER
jgi:hypothetical protein